MKAICFNCGEVFTDGETGSIFDGQKYVGVCDECHRECIENESEGE